MMGRVSLIAHRGQPLSYPENSLEGFRHVLQQGTEYVETDVHISADGVPVLSHDANLLKLTGKQLIISNHDFETISQIPAGYAERFGDQFEHCRIASLQQFVELMQDWEDVTCFIELKRSSLSYFGDKATDLTLQAIDSIQSQCVFISFDYDALVNARSQSDIRLGWILPDWTADNKARADELEPDFLFVDVAICPQEQSQIWHGNWQWVAYTLNTQQEVQHYAGLGIELLETDRYSELKQESSIVDVSNDF